MLWISFAPIATIAETYYGTSLNVINWLSEIFMLCSIPVAFLASWALDARGLRAGVRGRACCSCRTWMAHTGAHGPADPAQLLAGACLNMAGSWIRYLSHFARDAEHAGETQTAELAVLYVGQLLAACAQPFILSAPTKLASAWFGDRQRASANMLASMSNPIGVAIGNVLPPIIVGSSDGAEIPLLMLVCAIPATVAAVLAILLVRDRPPSPPSASAESESLAFWYGMREIFRTRAYILLWIVFGIGVGLFNSMTTLLEQIVKPHQYTTDQAGILGAIIIGAGLVGAGVIGPVLDRTKHFLASLKILFVFAAASFIWFTLVAREQSSDANFAMLAGACGFIGMFCFALLPVMLELGVECTYPVAEGTSAGFLWMNGQIFGIVFIEVMQAMTNSVTGDMTKCGAPACACVGPPALTRVPAARACTAHTSSCYVMVAFAGLAFVLTLLIRTPLKRVLSEVAIERQRSSLHLN